jgi:maltose alpha-D-glucosyltransferase/alpha-amylase
MARARPGADLRPPDPLWYKDAIIYEVHVRAFYDANGDGIGDFAGLTQKLDYLQDLGITAIWLLPFYVSPLRDDGYDIADYRRIHPDYGTMKDFRRFLDEAHSRGLRVITELVINHTSDQHAWFQRARTAPRGSPWRDYYVWTDDPQRYKEVRIIFRDFEPSNWTWDPVAGQYYWHRFFSHQPDLNFENPAVRREILALVDFWFEMGVDGFRLDAIPYLFEEEGTSGENLPATHAFLKELRAHVDARYSDRLLLAEANQWPEDVAHYFGDGDECHMAYHFPLMPRLFMATRMEDRFPVTEILEQTPEIPANCQWAIFLRNHDELTLEMVSDEERDYMYRIFAEDHSARINLGIRRRLAPLLSYNRRLMELLNALLFSMQGTPVIYYGDEIAMGDNIYLGDRNGVRTPMQWSADRNAGFSRANPQRLYLPAIIDPDAHYETVNVETQLAHPTTFLWWMKRMIALRKRHRAFGRGSMRLVDSNNRKVLSFLRQTDDETILVVANLSRFVQGVELDLAAQKGATPVELIGQAAFPSVGDSPYFLSLGPHTFYWFRLERAAVTAAGGPPSEVSLHLRTADWHDLFSGRGRLELERALFVYVPARRWFGGKARSIRQLSLQSAIPLGQRGAERAMYCIIGVDYFEGEGERYALPLALVAGAEAERIAQDSPWAVVAPVSGRGLAEGTLLVDAAASPAFAMALLQAFRRRQELTGNGDTLAFEPRPGLVRLMASAAPAVVARGEQSNTTIFYGHSLALKLFRKLEAGIHPQVEIESLLAKDGSLTHVPRPLGTISLTANRRTAAAGVLENYVASECDAWTLTVDELRRHFEALVAGRPPAPSVPALGLVALSHAEPPPELTAWARNLLDFAELLGQRTAQLHRVLATADSSPAFAPEAFTPFYQQSWAQGLRARARRGLRVLRDSLPRLPEDVQELSRHVLEREGEILARLGAVSSWKLQGRRIRCHGDFHLGQVLHTGKDVVIIDFEGEPARALGERRIKRTPMLDVAGMLRSFNYAAHYVVTQEGDGAFTGPEREFLRPWADAWYRWTAAAFLKGYFAEVGGNSFVPPDDSERQRMLSLLLLDKALYEMAYELQNRPAWVRVPLEGIIDCLDGEPG